jgi:hypothetical protein
MGEEFEEDGRTHQDGGVAVNAMVSGMAGVLRSSPGKHRAAGKMPDNAARIRPGSRALHFSNAEPPDVLQGYQK